jgi:hypothetical protein
MLKSKPLIDHPPKPFGVSTTREKVCHHFLSLLAKWEKDTIVSTSLLEVIRRPKTILDSQPREHLIFWLCPSFPNYLAHASLGGSEKLRIVGQGYSVSTTSREVPNNCVADLFPELTLSTSSRG